MSALRESVTFHLWERLDLGDDEQTWRLKNGEVRFRDGYLPDRLRATEEQIDRFVEQLDELDFWNWKDDYDTRDTEWAVLDGGWWTFQASVNNREKKTGGWNAYPSLNDPLQTSVRVERYGQLVKAIQDIFVVPYKSYFSM